MVAEKKKQEEEVQFPLNQRLLEESTKIKEERKIIQERLKKIEGSRGKVSDSVYEKVKNDYLKQLNENTNLLLEKKQDIDRELSTLYEAKKNVEGNVTTHRAKLEELNFRHELGEYKDEEFHKLADEQNEKLGKFEKILAAIDSNIGQYESLFEGEEELVEGAAELEEAPPPPPPPTEPEAEIPVGVEEEYEVGAGEGYFVAVTEEVPLETTAEETGKEATPIEKEVPQVTARLTIEEGFGKGDIFEITKDEIVIGRAASNDVVLKEAKVSRQHASIKRQGNEYLIEDLHSSNGVFVNDERIKEHALSNGDIIRIGDFVLKFTVS